MTPAAASRTGGGNGADPAQAGQAERAEGPGRGGQGEPHVAAPGPEDDLRTLTYLEAISEALRATASLWRT